MSAFFDLLAQFKTDIEALEKMMAGGDAETVLINGVSKDSVAKSIADRFVSLQAMVQGQQSYETKALMDADLNHGADVMARVWNDTIENSGLYGKLGASGAGSWEKSNYDPLSFSYKADFSNAARNAGFEPVYLKQYHSKAGAVITADPT
ncbi:MAG: hypothetical protein RPR40_07410, partial [Bermanella sp.]